MHVRIARFEGMDPSQMDEIYDGFRKMVRTQELPEGMNQEAFETLRDRVRRVMSFADRETGTTFDLTFTDNAEDAKRVHEALDNMTPPEGAGRRTSVQTMELMMDEQL
jgi:hypothetical protein